MAKIKPMTPLENGRFPGCLLPDDMKNAVRTFNEKNKKNPLVQNLFMYSHITSSSKNYLKAIGVTPTKKTGIDILDGKKNRGHISRNGS